MTSEQGERWTIEDFRRALVRALQQRGASGSAVFVQHFKPWE